jgi:diadenosine tetraphosphate (Ap4A) HIT family hydrolase
LDRFELDARIVRDTIRVADLGLCELLLMNDSRWPWLVLVPKRNGVSEVFDLTPLDQTLLTFETNLVASALKQTSACTNVNVAAIGNIVRQLHIHVIARHEGDANWPGPVWGFGTAVSYDRQVKDAFIEAILEALKA